MSAKPVLPGLRSRMEAAVRGALYRATGPSRTSPRCEANFSNIAKGAEFSVEEAAEIVSEGLIPAERPGDAHDVLGTFRVVSGLPYIETQRGDFANFRDLLQRRHVTVTEARPEKSRAPPRKRRTKSALPCSSRRISSGERWNGDFPSSKRWLTRSTAPRS